MCGIFAVSGHPEAANVAYLGLHALQHRGQESAGIASWDGVQIHVRRAMGEVRDGFGADALAALPGEIALGHVRYSTAGGTHLRNAQPIAVRYAHGALAVAHNGNLTNAAALRRELEADGAIFQSTSDTEVLVHLLARARAADTVARLTEALGRVRGAWSLLFLAEGRVIAARDPHGFRPLVVGRLPVAGRSDPAWVLSSESCAFGLIGATLEREVAPGELVVADAEGLRGLRPFPPAPRRFCVFEHVYFSRPDSAHDGVSVYAAREEMGRQLAREHPVAADVVIPVPDSGVAAAIGYSRESGLPFGMGLVRSHYVGRTFIEPQQSVRHFGVRLKLSPVRETIAGRRVVVVDDSIVRGTTARKIVGMIREAGADAVHLRTSSPPTVGPCHYGIDTPTREELIAYNQSVEDIRRFVGCDTLGYLSREGLLRAVRASGSSTFCDACFSGDYPVAVEEEVSPAGLRLPLLV